MINLNNSHITDILPDSLAKDPKTQALSYALNRAMQRLLSYCQNISVYATIDTLPEYMLDLLAIELKTQYYEDSLKISLKRKLIKNTLKWYMTTGTRASVEEAVASVFGHGDVSEWFEYDGEPYCFKVYTSTMNTTDEMIQQLTSIVSSVQNVRSYLESVVVEVMQQSQFYFGAVMEVYGDSSTIGIDTDVYNFESAKKPLVLVDMKSGLLYAFTIVDGKLNMEETMPDEIDETDIYENIIFSDVKTGLVYEMKMVDEILTIGEVTGVSDQVTELIVLSDLNTNMPYSLTVVDGKLTLY